MLKSLIVAIALAFPASAAFASGDHKEHHADEAKAAVADMTQGEIKKVDKDNAKVTIKHGEIKNLDMPAMTMVFRVKDAALLDQLKPGDKIHFTAEKVQGAYTVTKVETAK